MKKAIRTIVYDDELQIEAYRLEGIVQPFPNHFHEHYVIGIVEDGQRVLFCKNRQYGIKKGSIVLFNPGDNHACVQRDDGALDYTNNKKRGLKMDLPNEKCVMIIDEHLPLGIIANTAAIMGITLGKEMPEVVGADVTDQSGNEHLGIIEFPVPILKGSPESIKEIREKLYQPEYQDLTVVDFSDLAQSCKTYDEFMEKMGQVPESTLQYFGIAICGAKKKVNKLTGSMPLLR